MTEHSVHMGGTALAEPPAPVLPPGDDDTVDAGNRRKLIMVGAGLGALLLLVVAYFLMKGGSTPASSAAPLVPHHPVAAPSVAGHKAGAAAKPLKLPQAYHGHVGRDPFKALYVAPVVQPSTQPNASTGGAGQPFTGNPSTTPVTQPTGSGTTSTSIGHPVWVELVKVNGTKSATFVVGFSNGKKLTTKTFSNVLAPTGTTGTIFAKQFTLLSIQNGEATIQFGDGTPIDIAPGAANRVVVN